MEPNGEVERDLANNWPWRKLRGCRPRAGEPRRVEISGAGNARGDSCERREAGTGYMLIGEVEMEMYGASGEVGVVAV